MLKTISISTLMPALFFAAACATTWRDRVPEDIQCYKGKGRDAALTLLEKARTVQFRTESEIRAHYKIGQLDRFRLYSNRRVRGATICFNRKLMYLHTTAGVVRVRKAEIQSQEF